MITVSRLLLYSCKIVLKNENIVSLATLNVSKHVLNQLMVGTYDQISSLKKDKPPKDGDAKLPI
jgi:hypothetical protein